MSVGLHVSRTSKIFNKKDHSYLEAIKTECEMFGLTAFAIFQIGPQNSHKNTMDIKAIKQYCIEHNISVYPHAAYVSTGIWNIRDAAHTKERERFYIKLIKDHLVEGEKIGAKGMVVHVPRHPIKTIVETMAILSNTPVINKVRSKTLPLMLLENPASRADPLLTYETPSKLNALVKALDADPRITLPWGLCIDTCHLWAGGVSLKEDQSWYNYESALTTITRNKIQLFHLNGSHGENFSTGKDRHNIPFCRSDALFGHLLTDNFQSWLEGLSRDEANVANLALQLSRSELGRIKSSSFFAIVQFCKKKDIGMILEINVEYYNSAKFAIDLIHVLLKM